MKLVDTGVWIDHLREPNRRLFESLDHEQVLTHPYVIGELALGNLGPRRLTLLSLDKLPGAVVARHTEVLDLIATHRIHGSGIGYVDAHLIASALLTSGAKLWTHDRKLAAVAERLGLLA